jgi:hypothetical protein
MQKISFLFYFNLLMGNPCLYSKKIQNNDNIIIAKTLNNYNNLDNQKNELINNAKRKKKLKIFNLLMESLVFWMILNLSISSWENISKTLSSDHFTDYLQLHFKSYKTKIEKFKSTTMKINKSILSFKNQHNIFFYLIYNDIPKKHTLYKRLTDINDFSKIELNHYKKNIKPLNHKINDIDFHKT